jgi:hypothetical protein
MVERAEDVCELLSCYKRSDSKGEWAEWAQRLERNCLIWEKYEGGWQGVKKGPEVLRLSSFFLFSVFELVIAGVKLKSKLMTNQQS